MAKKVVLKYNPKDFDSLRNSNGVKSLLEQEANKVKKTADSIGSGKYEVKVDAGSKRAYAVVKTTDKHSRYSNAKHNTLIKALRGGG